LYLWSLRVYTTAGEFASRSLIETDKASVAAVKQLPTTPVAAPFH